ncbi:cytochrome c oxidase subunit 3 [Patulibacter brassicae]|uniref:Cytochrome aa3 subunit 3 n=1 Tax=Patulibacter brassicae TaxID=1705717 RepID=A0ABU4VNN9_9ACTN|nr:cytochrome c oxidase subunit 3 [Patulibacter brassicae]MDX8153239.1 cytochrome c oxidase subunit 3 [Patulibacter brassicae]
MTRELPSFLVDRDAPPVVAAPAPGGVAGPPRASVPGVPGEPGLWIFLLVDMTIFAVFFGAFLVGRADEPAVFAEGRTHLSVALGTANTLVLLASSLVMALAVRAHRAGDAPRARRLIATVLLGGLLFVAFKAIEWQALLGDGHPPASSSFFTYYFAITGVHLLHLVAGAVVLLVVRARVGAGAASRGLVEGGASYWHMVDLLWLVIYPVVYFAGAT